MILVIYYSRTGNTEKIASKIAKKLNAQIEEINVLKDYRGFFGFIRAGYQAAMSKKPKIFFSKNLADFDLIVIGSPIWAGTICSPIKTFLHENKESLKKIAFFCTCGGEDAAKALEEVAKISNPLGFLKITKKELNKNSYNEKLDNFSRSIKKLS
ncbi:MAG: flavodoxin family protein [Candidatus Nanoarchaeia archaeon]